MELYRHKLKDLKCVSLYVYDPTTFIIFNIVLRFRWGQFGTQMGYMDFN